MMTVRRTYGVSSHSACTVQDLVVILGLARLPLLRSCVLGNEPVEATKLQISPQITWPIRSQLSPTFTLCLPMGSSLDATGRSPSSCHQSYLTYAGCVGLGSADRILLNFHFKETYSGTNPYAHSPVDFLEAGYRHIKGGPKRTGIARACQADDYVVNRLLNRITARPPAVSASGNGQLAWRVYLPTLVRDPRSEGTLRHLCSSMNTPSVFPRPQAKATNCVHSPC
ncbi:hypothetical protein GGR56DRAFT_97619 [Xylariaceae sp. FL0804]|nr:hypothetical protein GGR56DRAFT_97619 [Xylariaceae sp. FL0804]